VHCRWGNKGEDGYTELSPALSTLTAAMKAFEQRFKIKTANKWSARHNFKPQSFHFQLHAHSPSGDVTSGDVTSGDVTSSDVKEEHVSPPPTTVSSKKTTTKTTTVSKSSVATSCNERLVRLVYLECREGTRYVTVIYCVIYICNCNSTSLLLSVVVSAQRCVICL
jgi:hypothetical protein